MLITWADKEAMLFDEETIMSLSRNKIKISEKLFFKYFEVI